MKRFLAVTFLSLVMTTAAYGQATRTWVSGVGDDANPCSRTAPCKTWAGAISKTAAGGEINAMDPGGYGALTITKSITIDGGGTFASSLSTGTSGFIVNGDANTVVTIRNVSINGGNSTFGSGIRILAAKAVNVDNVRIFNYAGTSGTAGRGIDISSTLANTRVYVNNVAIYNVGNIAVMASPSAGNVILTVSNSRLTQSAAGIDLNNNTKAQIVDTVISGNSGAGIMLEATTTEAFIDNTVIASNGSGVNSGGGIGGSPAARISNCTITQNGQGLVVNGTAQIISKGNNTIGGNGGNQTPTSTVPTT